MSAASTLQKKRSGTTVPEASIRFISSGLSGVSFRLYNACPFASYSSLPTSSLNFAGVVQHQSSP